METIKLNKLTKQESQKLTERTCFDPEKIRAAVEEIKKDVLENSDNALKKLTSKFDKVEVENLRVPEEEIEKAYKETDPEIIKILMTAAERIKKANEAIMAARQDVDLEENGYRFTLISSPIERVGLYVPGGLAFYPSTVLMLATPAKVAGVKEIALCTPPNSKDNGIPPVTLSAAKIAGVTEIYQTGGAQAIFAMAYGTDTIKPVDKIVGPGNAYVNTAKTMLDSKVGIDFFAGPSEILVLADETAKAEYIAWDLLSQAEHGPDSPFILITTSETLAKDVEEKMKKFLDQIPDIGSKQRLLERGKFIIVDSIEEGIKFANQYKAEHTEVITKNAKEDSRKIIGGAVFVGANSCVPAGDYGCTGANHTIPTGRGTRFSSPTSVDDFLIKTEYSEIIDPKATKYIPRFARLEGLEAHARAIEVRLKK